MAKKNRPKRFYDYSLLFCIIFLSVFGLVMIYSASSYTAQLKYNNAGYFMMRQLKIGGRRTGSGSDHFQTGLSLVREIFHVCLPVVLCADDCGYPGR